MRTVAELERWITPGRLLDVGSGRGELLEAARRRGWATTGIDVGEVAVREARELFGFELVTKPFRPGLVTPGSYDAVVFHHSIEHLDDPREALETAREALRPGGVLHVATVNARTLDTVLSRSIRRDVYDAPKHLFVFTDTSLRTLVGQCGYDVVLCRPQVSALLNPIATRAVLREVERPAAGASSPSRTASSGSGGSVRWQILSVAAAAARRIAPGAAVRLYAIRR
jgi:2-polyprenyl-3-methyl-5-hydroxy-6-metoxy-1,4-benzoquinol methylase